VAGISAAVVFFVATRSVHAALLAVLGAIGGVTAVSLLGTACAATRTLSLSNLY
jgi:hypothetical protein